MRLRIQLREAMEEHRRRTGERMTYERLAELTGLALTTLQSLGTRESYNTTLSTIAKLCVALECQPGRLLSLVVDTEDEA